MRRVLRTQQSPDEQTLEMERKSVSTPRHQVKFRNLAAPKARSCRERAVAGTHRGVRKQERKFRGSFSSGTSELLTAEFCFTYSDVSFGKVAFLEENLQFSYFIVCICLAPMSVKTGFLRVKPFGGDSKPTTAQKSIPSCPVSYRGKLA